MSNAEIVSTVTRLLEKHADPYGVIKAGDDPALVSRLWSELDGIGICDAANFGEVDPLTTLVEILECLGRFGATVPYAEAVALAPALARGASLPAGRLALPAVAWTDPQPTLSADGKGARASGSVVRVPHADRAGTLLVMGTAGGSGAGVVAIDAAKVRIDAGANVAGESYGDVDLAGARSDRAIVPLAADAVARFRARASICRSAMMVGAAQRVVELSKAFAQERKQFGRPISNFQVIQQYLALMAGEVAAAAAMTRSAALAFTDGRGLLEGAAAKIRSGQAAGVVARLGHQIHGAIGYTDETPLERLTRRLWSWRDEYGSESYWSDWLGNQVVEAGSKAFWPAVTASGLR